MKVAMETYLECNVVNAVQDYSSLDVLKKTGLTIADLQDIDLAKFEPTDRGFSFTSGTLTWSSGRSVTTRHWLNGFALTFQSIKMLRLVAQQIGLKISCDERHIRVESHIHRSRLLEFFSLPVFSPYCGGAEYCGPYSLSRHNDHVRLLPNSSGNRLTVPAIQYLFYENPWSAVCDFEKGRIYATGKTALPFEFWDATNSNLVLNEVDLFGYLTIPKNSRLRRVKQVIPELIRLAHQVICEEPFVNRWKSIIFLGSKNEIEPTALPALLSRTANQNSDPGTISIGYDPFYPNDIIAEKIATLMTKAFGWSAETLKTTYGSHWRCDIKFHIAHFYGASESLRSLMCSVCNGVLAPNMGWSKATKIINRAESWSWPICQIPEAYFQR